MANKTLQKTMTFSETAAFCSQMAMILKSGISSVEGISILREESTSEEERLLLAQIYENLQISGNLYSALTVPKVFPDYMLQMVNLGEQTGKLDDVMESLSAHYNREDNISRTLRNALTYPLIMISMMLAVIVILMVKVMPVFNQVFLQLGQEMTGFSKGILQAGNLLSRYSMVFLALLIVLALLGLYLGLTKNGKALRMRIGYRIPFTRSLYENIASCRFASGLSLTLSSGMIPEQSLELMDKLIEDPYFQKKINSCEALLDEGASLTSALLDAQIFTGIYAKMASVASRSGSLDKTLQEISTQYEESTDQKISSLLSSLEPTLVIILSLIVGMILLSVMLPLMGIMSRL